MMDVLGQVTGARGLKALQGKVRATVLDTRPPLTSPVTVFVMLLRAAGFEWFGAEKQLPDGSTGTSCFLNTVSLWSDGTQSRRVVWSFVGEQPVVMAGDLVTIAQMAGALGFGEPRPVARGAAAMLASVRAAAPWQPELPFNERGKLLVRAAAEASHPGARLLLADAVELYRGYVWKLSTPIEHPPHPLYGYPLDSHYRFRKGRRTGDVRQSICRDERMEELRVLGLR